MKCCGCDEEATRIIGGYSLCHTHATEITVAIVVGRSTLQWFRETAIENYAAQGVL